MKSPIWRWAILVVVWLLIWAWPAARHQATRHLQNSMWPLTLVFRAPESDNEFHRLAGRFPKDARVWVRAARETYISPADEENEAFDSGVPASSPLFSGKSPPDSSWSHNAETRRRLDLVIEKFPREAWIIAVRLRESWGNMAGDRVGGELSDPNGPANRAAGVPAPERRKEKPNFSASELQRVLALCRRGQKLEPQNAFFDWTEAYFLALAWRDRDAWRALDAATRKPRWNDHRLAELRAQIAARELSLGRSLLWEEKTRYLWGIMFPELGRQREWARIVSWEAIKAQRRGDHAQCLRLSGNLARMAAKMRDNSAFLIEGLVAVAIENIAIGGVTYDARRNNPLPRGGTNARQQILTQSFTTYATSHGRRDLAQWAARDAVRSVASAAAYRGNRFFTLTMSGTSYADAAQIYALSLAAWITLLLLPLALVLRLGASTLGRVPLVRGMFGFDQFPRAGQTIARRDLFLGALACGGFHALLYGLFGALIVGLSAGAMVFAFDHITGENNLLSWWNEFMQSFSGPLGSGSPWEGLAYGLATHSENGFSNSDFGGKFLIAVMPPVMGALWCAWRALEWQKLWQCGATPKLCRAALAALGNGKLFVWQEEFDFAQAALAVVRIALFGVFGAIWIVVAFSNVTDISVWIFLLVAAVPGVLLFLDACWRWRNGRARRRTACFGARLLHESWLGWLTLGSTLYLLLVIASLPSRGRAERATDDYLRYGEVGALRKSRNAP